MNEIQLYRGNNRTIRVTIVRTSGLPYNLSNCIVSMLVKKDINDNDSAAIINKSTANVEGTITNAINGIVEFYLIPADTNNTKVLKDGVHYPVDFEVETLDHKKYTVLRTSFLILKK